MVSQEKFFMSLQQNAHSTAPEYLLTSKISLIPVIDAMSLFYFMIPLNGIINEETGKSHVCFFMHL